MNTRTRQRLKEKKVRPFTVYLPEEMDEWLRQQAAEHGRTLTAQTVRVLRAGRATLSQQTERVA
jgi:plasmid stability protein